MEKLLTRPNKSPGDVAAGERRPHQTMTRRALRTGAFLLGAGLAASACGDGGGREVQVQRAVQVGPATPRPSGTPEKPKLTRPTDGGKIPMEVRMAAIEACNEHPGRLGIKIKMGKGAIADCEDDGSAVITYQDRRGVLVENYDPKNRFLGGMASLCLNKTMIQHSAYGGPKGGMKMEPEKDKSCKDGTFTIAEIDDGIENLPYAGS